MSVDQSHPVEAWKSHAFPCHRPILSRTRFSPERFLAPSASPIRRLYDFVAFDDQRQYPTNNQNNYQVRFDSEIQEEILPAHNGQLCIMQIKLFLTIILYICFLSEQKKQQNLQKLRRYLLNKV